MPLFSETTPQAAQTNSSSRMHVLPPQIRTRYVYLLSLVISSFLLFYCTLIHAWFAGWNLKRHVNQHHGKVKPFNCNQCPKKYTSNQALVAHTHRNHSQQSQQQPKSLCLIILPKKASKNSAEFFSQTEAQWSSNGAGQWSRETEAEEISKGKPPKNDSTLMFTL